MVGTIRVLRIEQRLDALGGLLLGTGLIVEDAQLVGVIRQMHEVDAVDDASQLDGGTIGEFEEG